MEIYSLDFFLHDSIVESPLIYNFNNAPKTHKNLQDFWIFLENSLKASFSRHSQSAMSLDLDFLEFWDWFSFKKNKLLVILFQVELEKPYTYPSMISEVFLNKNI